MRDDGGALARSLLLAVSPVAYVRSLGIDPFPWQAAMLTDRATRMVVNGARQSGKSTIVSAIPAHEARFNPGSLSLVLAATEKQAELDMRRVKDYIALDRAFPNILRSSQSEIELENKSIIAVVPATEKSARGYSKPNIVIVDEGSRVEDGVYTSGVMPMFTGNPRGRFFVISTPNGRSGFFARAMKGAGWTRYEVFAPYEIDDQEWRLEMSDCADRIARLEADGIRAFISPRHVDIDEQQFNLEQMGPLMYRQEYMAEFVEPDDQVFGYDDVDAMFTPDISPMLAQGVAASPVKALEW